MRYQVLKTKIGYDVKVVNTDLVISSFPSVDKACLFMTMKYKHIKLCKIQYTRKSWEK